MNFAAAIDVTSRLYRDVEIIIPDLDVTLSLSDEAVAAVWGFYALDGGTAYGNIGLPYNWEMGNTQPLLGDIIVLNDVEIQHLFRKESIWHLLSQEQLDELEEALDRFLQDDEPDYDNSTFANHSGVFAEND